MLTYGFYDSVNGDRKYNAEQVSSLFDGLIHDGIFANVGEQMMVKTPDVPGMSVLVKPGRAWLNHTWTLNDSPLFLAIEEADVVMNRIDAIVLEINKSIDRRENSIKVLKGTPAAEATKPSLTNTPVVFQYPLAYVSVDANTTQISQSMIENCVGTSVLPFVTGVVTSVSVEDLLVQWKTKWEEWFISKKNLGDTKMQEMVQNWETWWDDKKTNWNDWYDTYTVAKESQIAQWEATKQAAFDTWFQTIQNTLSGDTAGNLMNLISQLRTDVETNYLKKEYPIELQISTYQEDNGAYYQIYILEVDFNDIYGGKLYDGLKIRVLNPVYVGTGNQNKEIDCTIKNLPGVTKLKNVNQFDEPLTVSKINSSKSFLLVFSESKNKFVFQDGLKRDVVDITIPTSSWVNSNIPNLTINKKQAEIPVPGLKRTDRVYLYVVPEDYEAASDAEIYYIHSLDGKLRVFATSTPIKDIHGELEITREVLL